MNQTSDLNSDVCADHSLTLTDKIKSKCFSVSADQLQIALIKLTLTFQSDRWDVKLLCSNQTQPASPANSRI